LKNWIATFTNRETSKTTVALISQIEKVVF